MSETSARTGLRGITRDAVRSRIAVIAVARFDRDGFDAVTVDDIAAEVGISARSFHRYFPAKEDTVVGDPSRHRDALLQAFHERPADEPVWTSLREAFAEMVARAGDDPEDGRRAVRVMASTPSLRARNLEKHQSWAEALTPVVTERLTASRHGDPDVGAAVLVQAALGCFDVAIVRWAVSDDPGPDLLRRSFDALASAV